MMTATQQAEFPFASLDFAERETLTPEEVAKKLGVTTQHILDLIEEGALQSIDVSGKNNRSSRRCCKIPIESYRNFIVQRLTAPVAKNMILDFSSRALRDLSAEIQEELNKRGIAA